MPAPDNSVLRLRVTIHHRVMNNNNNNQTPLMQMRDRLFQVLFMRVSIAYASLFPRLLRRFLENLLLVFAFFSFFILAYTHMMFIQSPMNCLDNLIENWPKQGILRVEVLHRAQSESYTLKDSYFKEAKIRQIQGYRVPQFSEDDFVSKEEETEENNEEQLSDDGLFSTDSTSDKQPEYEPPSDSLLVEKKHMNSYKLGDSQKISSMYKNPNHSSIADGDALSKTWNVFKTFQKIDTYEVKEIDIYEDVYILEYSLEYGYLRLSPKAREKLNIPVTLVILDPKVDTCFGNWLTKMLLEKFLGYDNILMASIRKLAEKEENKGYVRNVVSDNYFRFVNIMNHLSYAYAAIIMLVFTLSISMLLRYSHHQIFVFIVHLLRLFELRGGTAVPAAPLLTVILALVGMEAIMSEFFSDPTTSFYVILIVWIADQYDAICCRTVIAKRHWLRFFYLYHYAFYAYDYRFSGQYSNLALFTSCCFILHSMVYFFHHYELPAILHAVQREVQPQQNQSEAEQVVAPESENSATIVSEETTNGTENSDGSNVIEYAESAVALAATSEDDVNAVDMQPLNLPSSSQIEDETVNLQVVKEPAISKSNNSTELNKKTVNDASSISVNCENIKDDDCLSEKTLLLPSKGSESTVTKELLHDEDSKNFSSTLCQNYEPTNSNLASNTENPGTNVDGMPDL